MNQPVALIKQLSVRLSRLESEISAIRHSLEALQQGPSDSTILPIPFPADKSNLVQQTQQLLDHFAIAGQPRGIEALQQLIAQANLRPNEVSQALINARDE